MRSLTQSQWQIGKWMPSPSPSLFCSCPLWHARVTSWGWSKVHISEWAGLVGTDPDPRLHHHLEGHLVWTGRRTGSSSPSTLSTCCPIPPHMPGGEAPGKPSLCGPASVAQGANKEAPANPILQRHRCRHWGQWVRGGSTAGPLEGGTWWHTVTWMWWSLQWMYNYSEFKWSYGNTDLFGIESGSLLTWSHYVWYHDILFTPEQPQDKLLNASESGCLICELEFIIATLNYWMEWITQHTSGWWSAWHTACVQ